MTDLQTVTLSTHSDNQCRYKLTIKIILKLTSLRRDKFCYNFVIDNYTISIARARIYARPRSYYIFILFLYILLLLFTLSSLREIESRWRSMENCLKFIIMRRYDIF